MSAILVFGGIALVLYATSVPKTPNPLANFSPETGQLIGEAREQRLKDLQKILADADTKQVTGEGYAKREALREAINSAILPQTSFKRAL